MGFQKYAAAEVLSAELAGSTQSIVQRTAHRHAFAYTPREGFLYVRSRAISSRTNDNYDEFPAEEIKKAYKTFVGRPVFVNHHNDDHRRARGVIIDAALHEDVNPDGSPDTWTEVLMEVDAKRFPLLAKAILAGEIDRTSMGTDVAWSQCTACNNIAKTPLDYCAHIPRMKGQRIFKATASGEKVGILVAERCYGLNFFENSLLVEDPADPTAFFLGVEAGPGVQAMGVKASIEREGKTADEFAHGVLAEYRRLAAEEGPSVAGVAVKAADTGRVLMLQRSIGDEDDPAAGTWEFPGGHVEGDEGLFNGAVREWQEETGHSFPSGDPGGVWDSGDVYRGFLWIVPSEDSVPIHDLNEKEHINPDDPDGDDTESVAWWEPEQLPKNPAVRDEVRKGTDWDLLGVTRPKTAKDEHRGDTWRDFGRPDLLHAPKGGDATRTDNGLDAYSDGYEDGFNDVERPMSQKYTQPDHADAFWEGYQDGRARRNQTVGGLSAEAKPRFEPGGHPWYQANPVNPQNIIDHFNRATPEDKEQGRRWYSDANLVATAIAGGDTHKGAGVLAAYSPQALWPVNMFNAARALKDKVAMGGKGSGVFATESQRKQAQAIIDGTPHPQALKGPKIQDFAHLIEHGGQHPDDPTTHVVIDRHALSVAAGKRLTDEESGKSPLDNRHYYGHVAEQFRQAADQISQASGEKWEPHQIQATTWLVRQRENAMEDQARGNQLDRGREKSRNQAQDTWESYAGEHYPALVGPGYHAAGLSTEGALPEYPPLNGELCRIQTANGGDGEDHLWSRGTGYPVKQEVPYGWGFRWLDPSEIRSIEVIGPRREGSRHEALGEQTAPAEVDTLRDEECPVCGEDDSFNGAECIVCGYVAPPKQFRDPDPSVAQNNDLRQDQEDAMAGSGLAPTPSGGKGTIIVQTKGGTATPTAPNTNTPQNSRPVTSGRRPTIRITTTRQKENEYA